MSNIYRGGCSSEMPKGLTAFDIINYEKDELGNNILVKIKESELPKIKSERLMWVTSSKSYAKEFGEVIKIEIENYRVIAKDPFSGMLIEY